MKKAFGWLGFTLAGTAISLYGNKKVREAIAEDVAKKELAAAEAEALSYSDPSAVMQELGYAFDGRGWKASV